MAVHVLLPNTSTHHITWLVVRWGLRHSHPALFKSFSIFCKFSCSNLLYISFPEVYLLASHGFITRWHPHHLTTRDKMDEQKLDWI
ncbi:hypothetical protein NC652_004096 [Populus alba x Populus x berolinensis]|nr:hypothetical protein NC652_004096 [Populus alba x Populus x berolinensis]